MAQEINGVVINEIFSTPTLGATFDTNQDGVLSTTADPFVELFNDSPNPVDLTNWTISFGNFSTGTFTFPSFTLQPGTHVVVLGAIGTLTEPFYLEGLPLFLNVGNEVILTDTAMNSISATFGGFTPTQANTDDFGSEIGGQSHDREPDGSDTINNVTPNPECFLTGTLILTENGYKAVEELKIGDLVQTADSKLEAVKWIGYQTINPDEIFNPLRGNPIQIKAGALGDNLPLRDLYVSPDHSMFIDGLLINAGALVNDISIVKTEPTETFVYYHVELENHCLLVAEGAAAESYLPNKEKRDQYDNFAEFDALYPHGSNLMLWPMDYPRISSWSKVPRFVSKKLLAIAHQLVGQANQLSA